MSIKTRLAALVCLGGALLLQACNFPGGAAPTPFVFPTPDMTLTAMFQSVISPTPPVVNTATQTVAPATLTPTPTSTTSVVQTFVPTSAPATTAPTVPVITLAPLNPTNTPVVIFLTNTPAPTTPTPVQVRPGPRVQAAFINTKPDIDGNLSEWRLGINKIEKVVYGANLWDGRDDLSGEMMVGWDNNNLYFGARVTDEDYEQHETFDQIWLGDYIEILLDNNLLGDFRSDDLSPDDYQVGISPGQDELGNDPEAYRWYPSERADNLTQVEIGVRERDYGYDIEIAIPWVYFDVTPAGGARYGFAFSISDNDRDGKSEQQSMVSNLTVRHFTDPTTWGELELLKP